MANTGISRIWWDVDAQAYRMITPFNPAFVDLFKKLMPASERNWDPDSKIWTFNERNLTAVSTCIETIFKIKPTVVTRSMSEKASVPPSVTAQPLDSVATDWLRSIPYEAAQQAYKRAALLMHPDRGGDMEKMSRMNALWQRLEKELWNK